MVLQGIGEVVVAVAELAGIDGGVGVRDAGTMGHGGHGGHVVAGDHLEVDALIDEELEDVGRVVAHGVVEQDQRHRLTVIGELDRS